MSALIHNFVVHRLAINDQQALVAIPRQQCIDVTPAVEQLAQQINHSFASKPSKGVGGFVEPEEAEESPSFKALLADYWQSANQDSATRQQAFLDFSVSALNRLLSTMQNTGTAETGYVLFIHYEYLATQYLMIALLNTRAHVEVNQSLELDSREHLDLARMQLAVRLDLTQWDIQPEQNRYVSFIKGRMGRKVSDFFMQFVGCMEEVDVKVQNKELVACVDQYLASEQLNREEQQQHRQQVNDYFKQQLDSGESIRIEELSGCLPKDEANQSSFASYTQNRETPLEAEIQPDPAALKQLSKFTGAGGGVSLSFDRKLLGERVNYDERTDTLVIQGIPPNLKDQLKRHSSGE